jgi:GNAT superfamily N-acetyltransferase
VVEPLLENPRAFAEKVAGVLGGTAVARAGVSGFLSSSFDPFLNHLFAGGRVIPRDVADALEGRPGIVWLAEHPTRGEVDDPGAERLLFVEMHGMTATTAPPMVAVHAPGEIVEVRSPADLDSWHEVYCEVFGADPRGRDDWHRVHDALGPSGDTSLLLLLARVDRSPAATGGVFYEQDAAGLYCFTTREGMRGRGLASALVHASHAAARERGIERALLQATDSGRPVYARAGYRAERSLPMLRTH